MIVSPLYCKTHRPLYYYTNLLTFLLYSLLNSAKGVWTEEQEDQLRMLFEENQRNPETDKGKLSPPLSLALCIICMYVLQLYVYNCISINLSSTARF